MMHLTDGVPLDPEIAPLCAALDAAGCGTIYSCAAHFDREPQADRAYVTFTCTDIKWMERLSEFLRAPGLAAANMRRELRFDCLLGRYTVSLWAPNDPNPRAAIDAALQEWTVWVRTQPPAVTRDVALCPIPRGGEPQWPVPCQLALDGRPKACPWTETRLADPPRLTCRTALQY